jgi:hypothetical protein
MPAANIDAAGEKEPPYPSVAVMPVVDGILE